jgi:hypothetical protein
VRCARRGFGTSRSGLGASNGDGFAGTPVTCASAGTAGGVAVAGGVAGAVAGGVAGGGCTWATTGTAAVRGCDATFMITAPAMAPAATRITMCSGFTSLNLSRFK